MQEATPAGARARASIASAPEPKGGSAISLRAVTKRYGDEPVVDRVSIEIEPGEFFSLLGPSGSGKTTTLMSIAGFASVDEGQIFVDGIDIAGEPPQRRGFGMVFQNYAIFPHLDVFENVAFPLRARGVAAAEVRSRVAEALALVRLEQFGPRYARQLSGGQQQRVAIARAIVFRPKVVLMDEPLGALDKNLRYEMQVEIKDIQRRLGMTVVYVTHDQEEAMNMSDRIGIMNRGRVEQTGPPTEVYERPSTTFIGRFLGEANLLEGEFKAAAGDVGTSTLANGVALRALAPKPFPVGSRVSHFVRPERIALSAADDAASLAGDVNRLNGRIRRISFLGNIIRYLVDAGGVDITVDVQNARAARLELGHPVGLSWAVRDGRLLEGAT